MKKSRLYSMALAILMPLAALADSYTSLWKQYDSARGKDHPQTVQKVLSQIAAKAQRERAYGHLLKAQTALAEWSVALSPDSLLPAVERLHKYESEAVANGDRVLSAVYESVLGSVYTDNAQTLDDGEAMGREYFRKSMANPDALAAAFSTGYEPFVIDGVDSKYFYDDMLHIIGMRAGDYRTMHDYYAAHGKREGACLTALELVKKARRASDADRVKKSKYIMSLDSLVREYGDLQPCAEVAIERYAYMENAEDVTAEDKMSYINYALMKWGAWPRMNILRNAQRRLTLPSFHASIGGEMALPGVPRNVVVMALNNIGELRITATRLDLDGTTQLDPTVDKDYARLRRHIVQGEQPLSDVRRYVGQAAYKTVSDTLCLNGLRSGIYLIEMSTDNVGIPTERCLLRVCNIYPVIEAQPEGKYRIAVLDATHGTPVAGAKIDIVTSIDKNGNDVIKTYECDKNGEAYIAVKDPVAYRVYTDVETAFPRSAFGGRFYYYNTKNTATQTTVYTDRRIYRPGQTVHVAALAYTYDNKVYKGEAKAGQQMTITLRDANRKEVASQTVTTDDFGMASCDFTLPQSGLTGVYTLRSDYGNSAYTNFSVEEYRRPTFRVDIDKAQTRYAAGDTVRLMATAKSFAGVPVPGARVAVQVVRRPAMFWRGTGSDFRQETVFSDTLHTSADGTFAVKVPISIPDSYDEHPRRYYTFDVSADVTDAAGETRHGELSLPYSDHPTMLTCDIPAQSLRDSLRTVTFAYRNNAGEPINGDVSYTIDSRHYTCQANTPAKLDGEALASGRHSLVAVCGSDTLRTSFVTFSLQDRKAPVETHDWFWQSASQFPAGGGPVFIQLGSSDSIQHVVYTLVAGNKIIEDGRADLKNELRTRALMYKDEWGDGVTLSVTWVKSGHSYSHTARIERPLPDTRLNMKWTSFRDRLVPGQRETWTLNISRPDGKPAKAQLLAMMYDKSLDDIRPHKIDFRLPAYTNVAWMSWRGVINNNQFAYSEMPIRFLDERSLDLSRFIDFNVYSGYGEVLCANPNLRRYGSVMIKRDSEVMAEAPMARVEAAELSSLKKHKELRSLGSADMADNAVAGNDEAADGGNSSEAGRSAAASDQIRENLQETAFFYPGLVSDDKGNVSMQFTLPESVTTWQFHALAHDRDMNSGILSATSVARKTVMVQPNVPRFVRSADHGTLSARIANTSGKTVGGTARLVFIDPVTEKEVFRKEQKFSVKAGETVTADFDFDMAKIKNDGLLVCRVTAQGHGYSDGEQHYLPVLPDRETVTSTIAFSQDKPGTLNIDLASLFPAKSTDGKLTVEYTNSPSWLMIQALPSLASADGDNAISLASAYYANAVGRSIMQSAPSIKQTVGQWKKEDAPRSGETSLQSALQKNRELKQMALDETPWLMDADRETEQKQMLMAYFDASQMDYRLADNLSRLEKLQREDGSFAWWKGMEGSPYMTMAVLQTLVRTNVLAGNQPETAQMTASAFGYMDRQMAREVKDMKKAEREGKDRNVRPSETAVQYLYASTLAGRKMSASAKQNFDYLVARLAAQNSAYSIYGKAVAATVLARNGHAGKASELLESIRQYTVYKETTGRYFDTPKALYSWFDYRIPSQVAAIEALQTMKPGDTQTVAEMQRWLLQSKRTQAWDTPLNSVNAIYAFLNGNSSALADGNRQPAVLKLNGQKLPLPKATAGLGYVKSSKEGNNFRTLTAEKTSDGTSWGAVYAQFVQPTTDVADASTGMTVEREVMKNGRKLSSGDVQLRVGDRITVRLTVTADRDYDFVQLSDRRAACLEPAQQLSGYAGGYYCQPKDNATSFFFDRMSKGRHVIETVYYVDRMGQYATGTCTVQCAYAPEFTARTKAVTLNVIK